jgi:ketosteroid isomerase-like protein
MLNHREESPAMKTSLVILWVASFILCQTLAGCQKPTNDKAVPPSANVQTRDDDVRKKIERISDLLSKAALENDFDAQLKYFTEDAIINPVLGPEVRGKAEIRKGFEKSRKAGYAVHSHNTTTRDIWVCGDRVYERGKWGMSHSLAESRIPKAYHGSYFTIWIAQTDGSYLIDYIIFTLDFNPYEG